MYTKKQPFFLVAETPIHAGSGSDLGIVDLPIQRERHTGYPKIEASGLKGPIREFFENVKKEENDKLNDIFGKEEGAGFASAVGFLDARLLFFPIKSVKGVFAYVTCPDILKRFFRDLEIFGMLIKDENSDSIIVGELTENSICKNSNIAIPKDGSHTVLVEEYAFENCAVNSNLTRFARWCQSKMNFNMDYWSEKISKDLLIIDNDTFKDFVTLYSEVIARTKIDSEKGNVKPGALWYEEYLPADSILYSCIMTADPFIEEANRINGIDTDEKIMAYLTANFPQIIQLGGNATIGKGLTRLVLISNTDR